MISATIHSLGRRLAAVAFMALATAATALAQGKMNYTQDTHDFGEVPEGKIASYEFEFTNTGSEPVIISNVQASCGCTTPFWTKEPVLPGKIGKIKASYNSKGRPGPFNKSITVTSNAGEPTKVLSFKGVVLRMDQMPTVSEEQKKLSAKIVYDRQTVNLGKLQAGQTAVARFSVTNKGKSDLEIYDVASAGYTTSWHMSEPVIKPGQAATLEVTYTAKGNPGKISEALTVIATDYNNYTTKLTLEAEILPTSSTSPMKSVGAVPFK